MNKQQAFISAYTPGNMAAEVREAIFVQRHKLLEMTVRWLAENEEKHLLFIGPRGSGKTMLVAMAEHRITQDVAHDDKLRIAWLGEDDVITGFIDLVLAITQALINRYPQEFDATIIEQVRGQKPDDAATIILHTIVERLKDRRLLLIMENLDFAFRGLQDLGQKKWRAFLQESNKVSTLATSQKLFAGVSSRDAAFFGFFDVHHLEPLSCEEARLLVRNIAEQNQNMELVEFLDSPTGRYRIRALHHLAGGNHRLFSLLSVFLSSNSLEQLGSALERMADDLTPYYQERIRELSPQQARIVLWLCEQVGATSVKSISEAVFVNDRIVSKQLAELKRKGYVQSYRQGKESYFELSEPLMRLTVRMKNKREDTFRFIATVLKVWFSTDDSLIAGTSERILSYQKPEGEVKTNMIKESGQLSGAYSSEQNIVDVKRSLKKIIHEDNLEQIELSMYLASALGFAIKLNSSSREVFIDWLIQQLELSYKIEAMNAALISINLCLFSEVNSVEFIQVWHQYWQRKQQRVKGLDMAVTMLDAMMEVLLHNSPNAALRLPKEIRTLVNSALEQRKALKV